MQTALKKNTPLSPLDFKLLQQNFLLLEIRNPFHQNFFSSLSYKLKKCSLAFKDIKLVLDLRELIPSEEPFPLKALLHGARASGLEIVGLLGGSEREKALAEKEGLSLFPLNMHVLFDAAQPFEVPQMQSMAPKAVKPASKEASKPGAPSQTSCGVVESLIINEPVRSGKQIYAEGRDLVVLAPVSPGAELVADGNIHIYGSLRGKAIAGFKGNKNARIFCSDFQGELVSIAGIYETSEAIGTEFAKKSIEIHLKEDALIINLL